MDDQSKIFVVIAVLSIILVGIALYMYSIDRKLNKVEDSIKELESKQ